MLYLVDLYDGDSLQYDTVKEIQDDIKADPDNYGPASRYEIYRGVQLDVEQIFKQALAKAEGK